MPSPHRSNLGLKGRTTTWCVYFTLDTQGEIALYSGSKKGLLSPHLTITHLFRCLVYIDLNMVRAGAVGHPSEWPCSRFNEIQEPKRKNVLIDYEKLRALLGFENYDQVKLYHKKWVDECLGNEQNIRDEKWTRSIAVGSRSFVDRVESILGVLALGRKSIESGDAHQLREPSIAYGSHFGVKRAI